MKKILLLFISLAALISSAQTASISLSNSVIVAGMDEPALVRKIAGVMADDVERVTGVRPRVESSLKKAKGRERDYPDGRTFPNLFDAHPPFQIDGGYEVSIAWKDGRLLSAEILPKESGTLRLRTSTPIKTKEGRMVREKDEYGMYEYEVDVVGGKMLKVRGV